MTKTNIAHQRRSPISKRLMKQVEDYGSILFILYFLEGLLLLIVKLVTDAPIDILTRDPLAVHQINHVGKPYVGLFSNIGILFWCSTVAICLFSYVLLRKAGNRDYSRFILASGVITFILLIDDLFMIHEEVFPNHLNISEKVLYVGYAILMVGYLFRFRATLFKTDLAIFLLASVQLFLSISLDNIVPFFLPSQAHHQLVYLLEDGVKLLGITTWLVYFSVTCAQQVARSLPLSSSVAMPRMTDKIAR